MSDLTADYLNVSVPSQELTKQLSAAGEVLFKEPLSDWTRKLQVVLLLLTLITAALGARVIQITEFGSLGTKGKAGTPESVSHFAALVTTYLVILYCIACYQDLKLHTLRSSVTLWETGTEGFKLHAAGVERSMATITRIRTQVEAASEAFARWKSASDEARELRREQDTNLDAFPSWKRLKLSELEKIVATDPFPVIDDREDPQKKIFFDAAQKIFDFIASYRRHIRLRILVEVLGPSALAVAAASLALLS